MKVRKSTAMATVALSTVFLAGSRTDAGATVFSSFTNSSFITMTGSNNTLTFTFDGKSAANLDDMKIVLTSSTEQLIVTNQATVGTTVTVTGLTPGHTYG